MRHQTSKVREDMGYVEVEKEDFTITPREGKHVKAKHIELPKPTLQQHLEALSR